MNFLYLLPFKNGKYFKIGITKNDSTFERIKKHNNTFSIDLENSFLVSCKNDKAIPILEKELLLLTKPLNYDSFFNEFGTNNDGYTEVRNIEDMNFVLSYIEDKKKYLDLIIDKNITYPVKEIKLNLEKNDVKKNLKKLKNKKILDKIKYNETINKQTLERLKEELLELKSSFFYSIEKIANVNKLLLYCIDDSYLRQNFVPNKKEEIDLYKEMDLLSEKYYGLSFTSCIIDSILKREYNNDDKPSFIISFGNERFQKIVGTDLQGNCVDIFNTPKLRLERFKRNQFFRNLYQFIYNEFRYKQLDNYNIT